MDAFLKPFSEAFGGCELVALCEPDPAAIGVMYAKCAKGWEVA